MNKCKIICMLITLFGVSACFSSETTTSIKTSSGVSTNIPSEISSSASTNSSSAISIVEPNPDFYKMTLDKDSQIVTNENKAGEILVDDAIFSISGASQINNKLVKLDDMGLLALSSDMGEIISLKINYNWRIAY